MINEYFFTLKYKNEKYNEKTKQIKNQTNSKLFYLKKNIYAKMKNELSQKIEIFFIQFVSRKKKYFKNKKIQKI